MFSRIQASGNTFTTLDGLPKGSAGTLYGLPKGSAVAFAIGFGSGITSGVGLFGSGFRTFGVGLLGSSFRSTRGGVL